MEWKQVYYYPADESRGINKQLTEEETFLPNGQKHSVAENFQTKVVDYNFLQLSIKCTILWFGILFTLSTYFSN